MKMFCISDDIDIATGLKLSGIKSVILESQDDINNEIDKVLKDSTIGVLIITDKIYNIAKQEIDYIKNNKKLPLVVNI